MNRRLGKGSASGMPLSPSEKHTQCSNQVPRIQGPVGGPCIRRRLHSGSYGETCHSSCPGRSGCWVAVPAGTGFDGELIRLLLDLGRV